MTISISPPKNERGSILVSILVLTMVFSTMLFSLVILANSNLSRARGRILLLQAQYAAESGADTAIATLNSGIDPATYTGTASDVTLLSTPQYKSTYTVSVTSGSNANEKILTATGKVYAPASQATPRYTRTIRVVTQRGSSDTATSLTSRNIIAIDSGVKDLTAKDIYVNGYITMAKNTTNLIAENITVAGKNTGAGNCSISGSGNLVKPSSFSDPSQTKTNLLLAFNNCISPPGNTSNTDFNVTANSGSIAPVQSTYIPWSQYMDSSYTDAGNCTDWTSGSGTINIPSVPGSKKTQYPDSGSNISTACGNSGDITLASGIGSTPTTYNITDNVHIRANLCAATACTPAFNNPTATIKYVFVEGTINFAAVYTPPGSGPIAFITYGADPASKNSVCPYGGSIYLGNTADSSAPSLYFMATNGICLDKTKFSDSTRPALGGLGGKNIYVAVNPSTPRDLNLDPSFPTASVPINLSWRAVRYERL